MVTNPEGALPVGSLDKALPEFALKIRELRKLRGLTQPQFAAEVHTSRGTIARWEIGTREPSAENYSVLCRLANQQRVGRKHETWKAQEGDSQRSLRGFYTELAQFFFKQQTAKTPSPERKSQAKRDLESLEIAERMAVVGSKRHRRILKWAYQNLTEIEAGRNRRLKALKERKLPNGKHWTQEALIYGEFYEIEAVHRGLERRAGRVSKRLLYLQRKYKTESTKAELVHEEIAQIQRTLRPKLTSGKDLPPARKRLAGPSFVKLEGRVRYSLEAVRDFIASRTVRTSARIPKSFLERKKRIAEILEEVRRHPREERQGK
jgi:transcriptional regulator with XRE-family HTH domain